MKIVPIGLTQTNWLEFIPMAQEVIGRSPMRCLDSSNVKPGDPFSYITALQELDREQTSPRDAVRFAGSVLEHIHTSFLIHLNDRQYHRVVNLPLLRMSAFEGKDIPRQEPDMLVIISGSLFDWKAVVSGILTTTTDETLIELFDAIFIWFKKMNLRELFSDFTEVELRGGGFKLERKR